MPHSLRILVAGAGIGGLAAALACSRAGHRVEVLEKSAELAEVGAGIQLGPNVTRILHAWGLAKDLQPVVAFPQRLQVRDVHSGRVLGGLQLGQTLAARYGAPYVTIHRADLQRLLADNLLKNHGVSAALGHAVTGFGQDDHSAQLQLTTPDGPGLVHQGELIVGADGLWSPIRQRLLGDGLPQDTGHVAYRCLIRLADLPSRSRAALGAQDVGVWLGPDQHWVHYPVRGGEWLNVVVILARPSSASSADWSQSAEPAELLAIQHGLNSVLLDLLAACHALNRPSANDVTSQPGLRWRKWNLFARAPMQGQAGHGHGRVALLGDAAHPMVPYLAQGAGMAIEDAHALAAALVGNAGVPSRVESYAQARWQRNARVQRRAERNGQIFHARGLVRWGRDISMRLLGERLLDMPWLYRGG